MDIAMVGPGEMGAIESATPITVLALQNRFRSRHSDPFGDELLAARRNRFGGHAAESGE